jgi:hypothetical protein
LKESADVKSLVEQATAGEKSAEYRNQELEKKIQELEVAHAAKLKLTRFREEMRMATVDNNSATATSLIEQQEKLEKDKRDLEASVEILQADNGSKAKLVEELNRKLTKVDLDIDKFVHAASAAEISNSIEEAK